MSDRRWEPENFENLKTWKLDNFENIKNYHWDMLNSFCFHVHAQKSLFKVENVNGCFFNSSSSACEFANHRASSQLKIKHVHEGPPWYRQCEYKSASSLYDTVQNTSFFGILDFKCTVIKNNKNIVDQ